MKTATLNVIDANGKQSALILGDNDLRLLVSAMAMVTPSGGGSAELSLSLKMQKITGLDVDDSLLRRWCNNILQDSEDAGVIEKYRPY